MFNVYRSLLAALSFCSTTVLADLVTVQYVDLNKYVGDWYQIANIPQAFEGGKCACARQRLTPADSGTVRVYNSCNTKTPSGKLRDIEGLAYNDDPKTNSKFTVDFNLPWKGTYWIIGLDAQYRYAVVSDAKEGSLYILSKAPTMTVKLYKQAVAIAAHQGLDTSKLVITEHRGCSYPN